MSFDNPPQMGVIDQLLFIVFFNNAAHSSIKVKKDK